MNRVRFQELLDSRGSNLAKWPEADRIAAERLIASNSSAAKAFDGARHLDRLIEHTLSGVESDPEQIAFHILAGLPKKLPAQAAAMRKVSRLHAFLPAPGALWPRVAVLSFAAGLGIAFGLFWAERSMLEDRQAMAAASGAGTDVTAVLFETDTAIGTF
ncbi:MAG: hypothetical protein ACLP7P_02605 [Rhodomicrobium sp.]